MRKQVSYRTAARIGTAIMVAILAGTVALTLAALVWSREEVSRWKSAVQVSHAYNETAMNAALASIHWSNYVREGDEGQLAAFERALRAAMDAEEQVKLIGTAADRAFLADLERRYATELLTAVQAAEAIRRGSFDPDALAGTTTLTEAVEALTERAQAEREAALANLSSGESNVGRLSAVAILLMVLGLPLVIGSYVLTQRYEHMETLREVELERLRQAALTDGLTGLPNHRSFQDALRAAPAFPQSEERWLTIAMMDVDDFKQVNDANGHAHGDAVLAKLASLTAYMRVGSLDRAFRVGGDEFALIMPETDTAEAHAVLERLRASIEASLPGITVSIGYSSAIGPTDPDLLRHHADMALYAAKRRGKNQVVAFYPAEGPSADVSTEQAEALRRALQTGNLSIWYQPIYEHRTGQLLAFEALLRLPSPPALLDSHEARRIASELGLTRDLDLLGIARALNAEGLPPDVKLFLSIDPATLMSPRFAVTELTELVSTSPFQPSQVVFQVAVDASVQAAALQRPLRAIQTAGFGLALTPAGTAQAGLEGLRAVHFDYVKVGRSILADAAAGDSEALLAAVAFARGSGARLIAGGIDDEAILTGLARIEGGADAWLHGLQGNLLGAPRSTIGGFATPTATTAPAA